MASETNDDADTADLRDAVFVVALPHLRDVADSLEARGFTPGDVADAFLTMGLTIGTAATSPAQTALTLEALAMKFREESVEAKKLH